MPEVEQPTISTPDLSVTTEADASSKGRPLIVGDQQFLTDLPDDVEPFTPDTIDATTAPLNPKDLDKLQPGAYTIYFVGEDQVEPYVPARSIVMRDGPKGLVVDSESFTPTFDGNSAGWTFPIGSEKLLQALGYEFATDESDPYIFGVPTPETLRKAAAEYGVEVEFFDEKEIRSPDYLAVIAKDKYPVSYAYFDHDIGDDHITAFLLGGGLLKDSLSRVAQDALQLDRTEQDRVTAEIDTFTGLYRLAIAVGVDNPVDSTHTGRQRVHEAGQRIGLTETEINKLLQVGVAKAEQFEK